MKRVAVILSGCGHKDGAEIRESIITLLELDKHGAEVVCFAPDILQQDVVNHLTGQTMPETRNVRVEAARIARGQIEDLRFLDAKRFDALILPGGFGAAKNLSNLALGEGEVTVLPDLKKAILSFMEAGKPIGAICIAPAVLTAAVRGTTPPVKVTVGEASHNEMIAGLGGIHEAHETTEIAVDTNHNIISTSAYMREDRIARVAEGISKLVARVLQEA